MQINLTGNRLMSIPASWSQMIFLKVRLSPCAWVACWLVLVNLKSHRAKTIEHENDLVQDDNILHAAWEPYSLFSRLITTYIHFSFDILFIPKFW